jgi:hypothetical protein
MVWSSRRARTDHILFDALIVIGPCAYVRRRTFPAGPVVQVRIIVCLLLLTTAASLQMVEREQPEA